MDDQMDISPGAQDLEMDLYQHTACEHWLRSTYQVPGDSQFHADGPHGAPDESQQNPRKTHLQHLRLRALGGLSVPILCVRQVVSTS